MFKKLFISVYHYSRLHRSLNVIVAQLKNGSFGVNTTTELKNVTTTSDATGTVHMLLETYPARCH
jgi:hypothetical protein